LVAGQVTCIPCRHVDNAMVNSQKNSTSMLSP
jgi:hypothetical protein